MGVENVRTYDVLLVESNTDVTDQAADAFERISVDINTHTARDKEEALYKINQRGDNAETPPPDFIILGLPLTDGSGIDLLTTLREDPELYRLPVLVMVATDDEETVRQAYELKANAFIQKPDDTEDFDRIVSTIADFWFEIATLPPKPKEDD